MDVFVSWSGEKSKALAAALAHWVPNIVQAVTPWLSVDSVTSGVRWTPELTRKLEATNFGILAITPSSVNEPWLVYEAGALTKMADAKVVPVVMGVSKAIAGPLGQFQARDVSRQDLLALCNDLNAACGGAAIAEARISEQFDRCWEGFESALDAANAIADGKPEPARSSRRSDPDMIEEILLRVRDLRSSPAGLAEHSPRRLVDAIHDIALIDNTPHEVDYSPSNGVLIRYAQWTPATAPSSAVVRAFAALEQLLHMRIRWEVDDAVAPF